MKLFTNMFQVILNYPWAEMASSGLIRVVHIDALLEKMPKRIFFHVRESNHLIYYPRELCQYRM